MVVTVKSSDLAFLFFKGMGFDAETLTPDIIGFIRSLTSNPYFVSTGTTRYNPVVTVNQG
jgi:hypothetical protein